MSVTPTPRPYYIQAPPYRRNSAGIRVMHRLCHLLNRAGQEAWLYPTQAVNPQWQTPQLTQAVAASHNAEQRRPITVYPEIIRGNPYQATSVVRYLLNRPGLLGGPSQFDASDLLFAYTRELLPAGLTEEHLLFLPAIDSSIFHNQDNPKEGQRQGWLFYPGRHTAALHQHRLLAAQCTLLTAHWPASTEAMAALLRQSQRLYCFESTALALEAVLCGCPAIVLPSPFFNGTPLAVHELGSHGLAFENTPEAIAEAIASLPEAQENYAAAEKQFWHQLQHFIRISQGEG